MTLIDIVNKVSSLLPVVDRTTSILSNPKYLPGVPTMYEEHFVKELVRIWRQSYPGDFLSIPSISLSYPSAPRNKCDLVFSSNGYSSSVFQHEWAIEFKRLQLVGNNGKNNDYGIPKLISPYLKDRSIFHDVNRLHHSSFTKSKGVILYAFDYDFQIINARRSLFPREKGTLDNLYKVCSAVDANNGTYNIIPVVQISDWYLQSKGLLLSNSYTSTFQNANRHPTGGEGRVVGWEVR